MDDEIRTRVERLSPEARELFWEAQADAARAEGFIKLIDRAIELERRAGRPANEHMTLEEAAPILEAAGELDALEREYLAAAMDELVLVEVPEEDEES